MKLIVGLGNIGAHFDGTRHNAGFSALNAFAAAHAAMWQDKTKFKALVAELSLHGQTILLAKPITYYNLSGEAVRAIKDFYKIDNRDILVIHDDIDLPLGTLRMRSDGSDGGNNGIKSVIAHIGENFTRIRIGIANEDRPGTDAADFVLAPFTAEEAQKVSELNPQVQALIREFIMGKPSHKSLRI
jgi:peptidyl-tRNA hydrolase, PTH1 family